MALYIDPAKGSGEFLKPLIRLGVPAILKHLDVADFRFYGNGPAGRVRVGIERKRVTEITETIGGDKRFVGRQLPKLLKAHPEFPILIVEGVVRPDRDGSLLKGKLIERRRKSRLPLILFYEDRFSNATFERYQKFLATIRFKARLFVMTTQDEIETAFLIHALYQWFQKDWSAHTSVFRVEETEPDAAILDERTWRRKTFAQWPGVGWKRSKRVSQYFKSIELACLGNAELCADCRQKVDSRMVPAWMHAIGVKEGRITATKLVRVLQGRKGESDAEAKS